MKAISQELDNTLKNYEFIFKSISEGVVLFDRNYKYLLFNDAFSKIIRVAKKELEGRTIFDFYPDIKKTEFFITYEKVFKTGERSTIISDYIFNDGSQGWFENRVIPIQGDGDVKQIFVIIKDVTAEKEVIELQKKNRAWLENSPICTKILDLDFNLQYMSASGIRDLQIDDITQHYGKPYPFYFYPESFKNQMTGNLRKAKNTGQIIEQEASVVDINGNELWYHSTIVPVRDDKDQVEYIIVVSIETTKRKKIEEKDIWKTNIMKAINDVFKKVLTCETEEELGKNCLNVAQELSGAKFGFLGEINSEGSFDSFAISNPGWDECAMPKSTATRLIKGMEIRGMQFLPLGDGKSRIFNDPSNHPDSVGTPEGHPKITSLLVVPFIYKGEIIGQIGLGNKKDGFTQDDLEAIETLSVAMIEALLRKRAEENLRKSEDKYRKSYKRAEFYKDLFAHDINNILNGIKGASDLYLLYENDGTKRGEKHSLINIIKDQIIKGTLLVSNVQKLSQIEDGNDIRLKEMDVREFINEAKKYTQESFQERTIKIDEYYFIKKPIILANELLLDVFENILNNAVKYNDSPIVRIQTKISREIENGKKYVKIEFINNGIGVVDKKKEIIFKKGYKKEKGTKGMGFGLTLVKKLIKSYNGKIWVEDNVKGDYTQGSNFVLIIPEVI